MHNLYSTVGVTPERISDAWENCEAYYLLKSICYGLNSDSYTHSSIMCTQNFGDGESTHYLQITSQGEYIFSLSEFQSVEDNFTPFAKELLDKRQSMDPTIIFCQQLNDCADVFIFKSYLGSNFLISQTVRDHTKYRLVDMYTSCNKSNVKKEILDAFTSPESPLRVVIATTAFGLGINCPNVRRIIHLGPTKDIENYVQQLAELVVMEIPHMLHLFTVPQEIC